MQYVAVIGTFEPEMAEKTQKLDARIGALLAKHCAGLVTQGNVGVPGNVAEAYHAAGGKHSKEYILCHDGVHPGIPRPQAPKQAFYAVETDRTAALLSQASIVVVLECDAVHSEFIDAALSAGKKVYALNGTGNSRYVCLAYRSKGVIAADTTTIDHALQLGTVKE